VTPYAKVEEIGVDAETDGAKILKLKLQNHTGLALGFSNFD
jgi:hypothetical protein